MNVSALLKNLGDLILQLLSEDDLQDNNMQLYTKIRMYTLIMNTV